MKTGCVENMKIKMCRRRRRRRKKTRLS